MAHINLELHVLFRIAAPL